MCRSKCFKARTFVLGKGPSLILETEDSWEVLKENFSPPLHWGARINSGNRQVVIMMECYLLSYPWSLSMLKGSLTLEFTSRLRLRIKFGGCLEQVLDTLPHLKLVLHFSPIPTLLPLDCRK